MSTADRAPILPAHLAILAALTEDRARAATELHLPPADSLYRWFPADPAKRTVRLAYLAREGLVAKTDSGGPKTKARALWRLTPAGASVVAGYRLEHR